MFKEDEVGVADLLRLCRGGLDRGRRARLAVRGRAVPKLRTVWIKSSQWNGSSNCRNRRTCTSTVRPPAVMFFGHAPRNSSSRLNTRP